MVAKLKRLVNKKIYEDNIYNGMQLKKGFVSLIKNCVLK